MISMWVTGYSVLEFIFRKMIFTPATKFYQKLMVTRYPSTGKGLPFLRFYNVQESTYIVRQLCWNRTNRKIAFILLINNEAVKYFVSVNTKNTIRETVMAVRCPKMSRIGASIKYFNLGKKITHARYTMLV